MLIENQSNEDLSAREAADLLGVKLTTLYAYVSRGRLESSPGGQGREHRYRRADVEALRARGRGGGAAGALRWGEPVLTTSITEMTPAGPRYRGQAAIALARADTPFEAVAELLWTGTSPGSRLQWEPPDLPIDLADLHELGEPDTSYHAWAKLAVAVLAVRDPGRHDVRAEAVLPRARVLVRALAASLGLTHGPDRAREAWAAPSIAEVVARALGVRPRPAALRAIDRALVLMADHELNASTFAARVVASTRADVYSAALAGLGALSGPRHGAASDQVEALLAETPKPEDARRVIRERDRRGDILPGFGHPFYRNGDPRAEVMLETAFVANERAPALRRLGALADVVASAGRPAPNVDLAIVGLRAALGMPRGAGAGLFAVARCAGWVAHVLEQYEEGSLVRPRARYRAP